MNARAYLDRIGLQTINLGELSKGEIAVFTLLAEQKALKFQQRNVLTTAIRRLRCIANGRTHATKTSTETSP